MSEYDPETLMRKPESDRDDLFRGSFGNYMRGYSCMTILRTACEMGIFGLASKPVTLDEICSSKGTDRELTRMFCDSLVQIGLLSIIGDRYVDSAASALYLDPGSELYQGCSLEGLFDSMDSWTRLDQRLREGPEYLRRDQMFGERWIKAIAESCSGGIVGTVVDAVDERVDLSGRRTFLDLGGGHGLYTIGFVHRHPDLEGYVFDIPMMCPLAEENSRRYGVPLKTIAGDFYEDDLGGPYDVVFSSFNLSTSDIRMADRVYGSVKDGGILILRRHLPGTSADSIRNLEWSLRTWDGKGKKNYGGSWLPTSEDYLLRLSELGMETVSRERFDSTSELVILRKKS